MDGRSFDDLIRSLSAVGSRRTVAKVLTRGALGGFLSVAGAEQIEARKCSRRNKKCVREGQKILSQLTKIQKKHGKRAADRKFKRLSQDDQDKVWYGLAAVRIAMKSGRSRAGSAATVHGPYTWEVYGYGHFTGQRFWTYYQEISWTSNGSGVREIGCDAWGETGFGWTFDGHQKHCFKVVGDNGSPAFERSSQGTFQACLFKYGCLATKNPWITQRGTEDGGYSKDGGA